MASRSNRNRLSRDYCHHCTVSPNLQPKYPFVFGKYESWCFLAKPKENETAHVLGIARLTQQQQHESVEEGGKMTSGRQICPLAPTQIDGCRPPVLSFAIVRYDLTHQQQPLFKLSSQCRAPTSLGTSLGPISTIFVFAFCIWLQIYIV